MSAAATAARSRAAARRRSGALLPVLLRRHRYSSKPHTSSGTNCCRRFAGARRRRRRRRPAESQHTQRETQVNTMIWCRLKTAAFSDSIHANIKTRLQCRDRKFSPRLHARHHLLSVRAIPRTRRCRACYHYKLENSNVVACSHAHDSYKQARAGAIIGKQKHSLTIGAELSWFVQHPLPLCSFPIKNQGLEPDSMNSGEQVAGRACVAVNQFAC